MGSATLLATLLAAAPPQEPAPTTPTPTPAPTLTLPAYTGYAHPDPNALRRDTRTGGIHRCAGELRFYVHLATAGALTITPTFTTGTPPASPLRITIAAQPDGEPTPPTTPPTTTTTFAITTPGYHRITVAPTPADAPITDLLALTLTGPAATAAHASTVERRNAASVHLGYPVPAEHRDDVEWFYVELTPRTDPLYTYYMATGFDRGYFGMQVNHPNERRLIFSVWDAGNEPVDRSKVAAADRVALLAKGENVHASGFGNEGTGGHSHLVHDWQLGDTFRFLVHAEVDADDPTHTTYTGWFWFAAKGDPNANDPAAGRWGLIASFRAPKSGRRLHGLYSFNENFGGSNGDLLRDCEFGNAWIRTTGGEWLPLRTARFTHDGHGAEQRLDRCGGTRDGRFFLRNGGFVAPPPGAVTAARARLELAVDAPRGTPPATLPQR